MNSRHSTVGLRSKQIEMEAFSRALFSAVFVVLLLAVSVYCEEKKQAGEEKKSEGHKKAPVHDTKHVHNKEYV